MGPWGEMRLGPTHEVLGWCHTSRSWCYAGKWNERCVIPLAWSKYLVVTLQARWHSCRAGITEQGAHPRWLEARQQLVECMDYSVYRAMLSAAMDPANSYFAKRFPTLLLGEWAPDA